MRTISSRRFVGELAPPIKLLPLLGAGKMPPYAPPAVSNAWAFGLNSEVGIVLLVNATKFEPGVGRVLSAVQLPSAEFGVLSVWPAAANALMSAVLGVAVPTPSCVVHGVCRVVLLKDEPNAPPYHEVNGTVCCSVCPLMYFRHSML